MDNHYLNAKAKRVDLLQNETLSGKVIRIFQALAITIFYISVDNDRFAK